MDPSFETLDFDKKIILCVSGGKDSTAMALSLWDHCLFHQIDADISLLFGDTRINRSKGRETIKQLAEKTGWPIHTARYEGKPLQVLHDSFRIIPKAIEQAQGHANGGPKSYKTLFPCCAILKKKPMDNYIKSLQGQEVILLLGLKGGDAALHRKYRMGQLREWNTFYRRHKKNGILYYYPLRDCQQSDIERVLKNYGFEDVESSGCSICPIFCVADWKHKDPDTWRRSMAMSERLGIPIRAENQLGIEGFCTGGAQ